MKDDLGMEDHLRKKADAGRVAFFDPQEQKCIDKNYLPESVNEPEQISCPICGKWFAQTVIEQHAAFCEELPSSSSW